MPFFSQRTKLYCEDQEDTEQVSVPLGVLADLCVSTLQEELVGNWGVATARVKKLLEQVTSEIHVWVPPEKVLQRDESVMADVKQAQVDLGDRIQDLHQAIQRYLYDRERETERM